MKRRNKSRRLHPQVSVVFPVYNNADTMLPLIRNILHDLSSTSYSYEIVAIDDASTDGSQELLQKHFGRIPEFRILLHKKNKGSASTYEELFHQAHGERILLFSVDGDWDTKDILPMLNASEHADIVIGWRTQKAYRLGRLIVSSLYNGLVRIAFGVRVYDAGSNKVVKREIITSIPLVSQGVFREAERIIRASIMGYTVRAIPIQHHRTKKLDRMLPRTDLVVGAITDFFRVFSAVRFGPIVPGNDSRT